jgi:aryl-alcohol dehydrogenase-like predicted oxidoreductase
MEVRGLGNSGLNVSAIGLGCMGMSQGYGAGDDEESIRTLHRAIDLGVTFFDTAAAYAVGVNEQLVGRGLRGRRDAAVLATKCGIVRGPAGSIAGLDGSPGHVKESCEASLKRLGTDVIDLFYLHRVDPETPIEDSIGAMADLVTAGKVRYIGLSEAAPSTIRRAHAVHPIAALQSEYSLWWREPESTVLPICRELGIGFVPFSPLGRGFFGGQLTDAAALPASDLRSRLPRFQGDNLRRNLGLVVRLQQLAADYRCLPTQLALAWLLAKGSDIVPIPGAKRRGNLESNAAAAGVILTPAQVAGVDAAFPIDVAVGDRYAPDLLRWIDREPMVTEESI